jgi:hypothetical protein
VHVKKNILKTLPLDVRYNKNIVAVCPEKNKSLVKIFPALKFCTNGSLSGIIPSGGFNGIKNIVTILTSKSNK